MQIYHAFKLFYECVHIYTYIYLRISHSWKILFCNLYFLDYNAMHNNVFGASDKAAEVVAGRVGPENNARSNPTRVASRRRSLLHVVEESEEEDDTAVSFVRSRRE